MPTPVGFKVEFDANCGNLFPLVLRVAGWKFPEGDNLFLVDAEGKTLVEFSEVESGIYEAPTPGVGVLVPAERPPAVRRRNRRSRWPAPGRLRAAAGRSAR